MWNNLLTLNNILIATVAVTVGLWFIHWLIALAFLALLIALAAYYLLADGARRLQ